VTRFFGLGAYVSSGSMTGTVRIFYFIRRTAKQA
jgi:hypothetical protein